MRVYKFYVAIYCTRIYLVQLNINTETTLPYKKSYLCKDSIPFLFFVNVVLNTDLAHILWEALTNPDVPI